MTVQRQQLNCQNVLRPIAALTCAVLLAALGACADSSVNASGSNPADTTSPSSEMGGASGDVADSDSPAVESIDPSNGVDQPAALLSQLSGTYDLTGLWNGTPDDEALLVIREPSDQGVSEVVIYDFVSNQTNCYSTLPPGFAAREPVGERIFLDRILQFDDAVLSLSGTTLIIDYFDTFDFDNDGDAEEQIRYLANSVAQMESDIQPICP